MDFTPTPAQLETAAELIADVLIADGLLSSRELEALERYHIPEQLGLSHDDLLRAVAAHCRRQLDRGAGGGALRLVDVEQFERRLDRITDPALQRLICRAMLVLSKADGEISQPEQTLLRDTLTRWQLSLEDVRG
ncbi:MAG: TerB family tellurite resistance protein [Rhodocyclaceae bacterium]